MPKEPLSISMYPIEGTVMMFPPDVVGEYLIRVKYKDGGWVEFATGGSEWGVWDYALDCATWEQWHALIDDARVVAQNYFHAHKR